MASPKETLYKLKQESDCNGIKELIQKAFTTRTLLHFAHLSTKKYSAHMALGSMYDEIIDKIDAMVEIFQGKFGLLEGLVQPACGQPSDIVSHVKQECEWLCDNKRKIACGVGALENAVDDLEALYLQSLYKLENLQ